MTDPEYTIVRLTPARPNIAETMTEEDERAIDAHVAYLVSLRDRGILIHAGRTAHAPAPWGLIILKATERQAIELMWHDPAVSAGLQVFETYSYIIAVDHQRP